MGTQHTPGPWEAVPATEHHGWYVVGDFGNTIADCYTMSKPNELSTLNGGPSAPVPFMHEMDGPNARLIAAAPDLLEALLTKRDYVADAASGSLTYSDSGEGFIAMAKEDLARIDAAIARATNSEAK